MTVIPDSSTNGKKMKKCIIVPNIKHIFNYIVTHSFMVYSICIVPYWDAK